ncbi:hypothetical protein AX16_005790 [Volvariella volvacea WC 439]|nr:hypothetical protein AX16_005790 [Volvariella volvacea WC 439]
MHIASTINPSTKSSGDVPVLLACYQGRKMFLRKERGYENMIALISSRFGISQLLNGTEGLTNGANTPASVSKSSLTANNSSTSLNSHASVTNTNLSAGSPWLRLGGTSASASHGAGTGTSTIGVNRSSTSTSMPGQPLKQTSAPGSQSQSQRIRVQTCSLDICRGDLVEVDEGVYESMWDVLDEVFVDICDGAASGRARVGLERCGSGGSTSSGTIGSWVLDIPSEGGQDAGGLSPSPAPSSTAVGPQPQKAASENNDGLAEVEQAPASHNVNSTPRAPRTRTSQANQADSRTSVASNAATRTPAQNKRGLPINPSTPSGRGGSARGGSSRDDVTPRATQSHVPASRVPAQNHNQAASANPGQGQSQSQEDAQSVTASRADESPRFKVLVKGPYQGQSLEVWVRARHTARQVLIGTCRAFEVDPQMMRLFLLVREREAGGGRVVRHIECEEGMTMGEVGVRNRSKLRIVLDSREESEMTQSEAVEELVGDDDVEDNYRETEDDAGTATVTEIEDDEEGVYGGAGARTWR